MRFEDKKESDSKDSERKQSKLSFNADGTINIPGQANKSSYSNNYNKPKVALDIWSESNDENIYHEEDNVSGFNLYSGNKRLNSLTFSNNKTQEEVVNETIDLIKNGKKIVFIHGACGTGKSAIALNIAKKLGKASIVVPGKALQHQYKKDYSKDKYVLKDDHRKLKIKVITGRENHACLYKKGCSAAEDDLPCKIEIREKNIDKLREYLKQNSKVRNDLEIKDIKRMSVAPVCPYWSPIVPIDIDLGIKAEKKFYDGLSGIKYAIYTRTPGCSYYDQFNSYADGEVIVFNSAKYLVESLMNRKPSTEVEIIDECDEFLDNFSNIKTINFNRLLSSLNGIFLEDEKLDFIVDKLRKLNSEIIRNEEIHNLTYNNDLLKIEKTPLHEFLSYFLDYPEILDEIDEENYIHSVYETALTFNGMFDETYTRFKMEERGLVADLVSVNLSEKLHEMIEKNKALVFMSGTIHNERVLRDVFGITDFAIVEAETISQGNAEIKETGLEMDCKYENFARGIITREKYLVALNKSVEISTKPALVHVHAFEDLPSENEKLKYNLMSLMSKEKLMELQNNDKEQDIVKRFKEKQIPVLFTTKCNRGVDFPGDQCKSIIFTKFPNPNANGIFWKILREVHSNYYWDFYKDKAKREFLQKLYRGLRSKDDHVFVLSPDKRVLDFINQINLRR